MIPTRAGKVFLWFVISALANMGTGLPAVGGNNPLKVGFVYVSPVSNAGWTHQHDQGRLAIESVLGDQVKTKYIENVPEGAEAERVIRDLAQSGYGLIFATSFGYMNPTVKVARQYPKTIFEHAGGYKLAKNVGTYICRFYEGRYLTGQVAGSMTKTNTLGYVAAFPIPEVIRGINAYTRGARSVNPHIRVKVIWVNSWFDPGREREAAEALFVQGVDIITHHTDSTASVMAAEEKGFHAIGYHSDMSEYAPRAHLTAATHVWESFYVETTRAVLAGDWKPKAVWGGIKDGMVRLAPLNPAVPQDVAELVATTQEAISAGTLHPFQGPVRNQQGEIVIPARRTMTDKELLEMNYFVAGVQGSLSD